MIRTLVALLAALTVGTFVLLALETRPAHSGSALPLSKRVDHNDAVLSEVTSTTVPLLHDRWLNIVIHDSICDMTGDPTADCHFIIYGPDSADLEGLVRATGRWRKQARGAHIAVPGHDFNAVSIGICLEGDLADTPPSAKQLQALSTLTRALQRKLEIGTERVYVHSDLAGTQCPGRDFDVDAFRATLLQIAR
jgi:hypothetical protein